MGAWGTGIFDDDLAVDVKDAWEDEINMGRSPADAARAVAEAFSEIAEDPDEGPILFISLATLQLEARAVENGIRTVALASIPANLDRWNVEATPEDAAERTRVLTDLETKLRAS
jgi:hypothetical protein